MLLRILVVQGIILHSHHSRTNNHRYYIIGHHKFSNQLPVALSQTGSFLLDLTTEKTHLMLSRTLAVVAIILHSNHNRTNHHPGHHRF